MLSWLHCFSLHAVVVCQKYPQKSKELWAYQAFMFQEQRRYGGRSWLFYDSAFRQQIKSFETVDFAKINQSLYVITFLAYGNGGGAALFAWQPTTAMKSVPFTRVHQFRWGRPPGRCWGESRQDPELRRKRVKRMPCFLWNDGKCSSNRCRFEHVCS